MLNSMKKRRLLASAPPIDLSSERSPLLTQPPAGSRIGAKLLAGVLALSASCFAQFTAGVQGTVEDASRAIVADATVKIVSNTTQVSRTDKTDKNGEYRFLSLAPGEYTVSAEASGFATASAKVALTTGQNLNVPFTLSLASSMQSVTVVSEVPVLNTAESRNELTLNQTATETLPVPGRNLINLVTMAPGVTGLGTSTGGSPGSAVDNYGTELQVDASANGKGSVGNMYVVDGLDVTSFIRPGVLNLTPNPDSIQESSIQTNTFGVEYGRASGITMLMTTKSGSGDFHGMASDYFNSQQMWAGTHFRHSYSPFHTNNVSANVGGPIWKRRQLFGFFAVEPMWQSTSGGGSATYESPEFTAWAQQHFPGTIGTGLLTKFPATAAVTTGVSRTAAQAFPDLCGTDKPLGLPCDMPVFMRGVTSTSSYRNAYQYNTRIDKYWDKDRVYGTWYRSRLTTGGNSNPRPTFNTSSQYYNDTVQVNYTHTFSPTTLNEAIFSRLSVEGISPKEGKFSIPVVNVSGGAGFGSGFAGGDFIQHSYHWRDVLRHIRGKHSLSVGYEGWFGQDIVYFQSVYSQPTFNFNNILDLVQDKPNTESGLAFDPLSGKPANGNYFFAETTTGIFAQDTWRVSKRLTLNYGLRWDNFGNPHPIMGQVLSNFHLGSGSTYREQVANGSYAKAGNVFKNSIQAWSPRFGFAWDVTGNSSWVIRGGFGIYHDWLTLGNAENNLKGNPPGWISPTFYADSNTPPVFAYGTTDTYPFGYPMPAFPGGTLDSHGGLVGRQLSVGGNDVNMKPSNTAVYTATVERSVGKNAAVSFGYIGQRSWNLVQGSNNTTATSYGQDINRFPGDLLFGSVSAPDRILPSFGSISYASNSGWGAADGRYNAVYAGAKMNIGRRSYVNASYTWSRSLDNAGAYPSNPGLGLSQYLALSGWDAPHRVSASWTYDIPGAKGGVLGYLTNGWSLSGTMILQSGNPFTVANWGPFRPATDANGNVIRNADGSVAAFASNSGDYNADGNNFDYPNATSYNYANDRQSYLHGIFSRSQFGLPTLGQEGNEKLQQFRNPGTIEVDTALFKDFRITERLKFQLRGEAFNVLNRVNLNGVEANLDSGNFGMSTSQKQPRWIQVAAKVYF